MQFKQQEVVFVIRTVAAIISELAVSMIAMD